MLWLPPADWISSSDLVLEMELLSENDMEGLEAGEDYGEDELDSVVIMLNVRQIFFEFSSMILTAKSSLPCLCHSKEHENRNELQLQSKQGNLKGLPFCIFSIWLVN